MLKVFVPGIAVLSLLAAGSAVSQDQDGPIVTNRSNESADALKMRETKKAAGRCSAASVYRS